MCWSNDHITLCLLNFNPFSSCWDVATETVLLTNNFYCCFYSYCTTAITDGFLLLLLILWLLILWLLSLLSIHSNVSFVSVWCFCCCMFMLLSAIVYRCLLCAKIYFAAKWEQQDFKRVVESLRRESLELPIEEITQRYCERFALSLLFFLNQQSFF